MPPAPPLARPHCAVKISPLLPLLSQRKECSSILYISDSHASRLKMGFPHVLPSTLGQLPPSLSLPLWFFLLWNQSAGSCAFLREASDPGRAR